MLLGRLALLCQEERWGNREEITDILAHVKIRHERPVGEPHGSQDTRQASRREATAQEYAILQSVHEVKLSGTSS
jgi:hypothetical protein